jgi:hypothetical protein
MKKKYSYILILLLAPIFFSCEEYLDQSPEMGITNEKVFGDYYNFKGFLDRANGLLHNYVYDRMDFGGEIGCYGDEAQHVSAGNGICTRVNKGNWLDCNLPGFRWTLDGEEFDMRHRYREVPAEAAAGIRACNLALENANLLTKFPPEAEYTRVELKNQLIGQAYFLRGWFYFMLIRDFGGLPNMQKSFLSDADFDQYRPEYQESSKWAVQDLDSAISYLPENWNKTASKDNGRVTITTAKAVKEMILLYAASPNSNIPRAQSLSFNGTPEYNLTIAAEAMKTCIEALESAQKTGNRYKMYSTADYNLNFYRLGRDAVSDEAIFQPPIASQQAYMQQSGNGTAWYLPGFDGGWAGSYSVPTHNAVEWFETKDGWQLEDAIAKGSTWNPAMPYDNRDPRLKKFIFCHGDAMLTLKTTSNVGGLPKNLEANQPDGKHFKYEGTANAIFTGYFTAGKFRWPGNNLSDNVTGYARIFPFIRYAQLYLDYAELANELNGPVIAPTGSDVIGNLTAVDAINIVRNRVEMPIVKPEYYASKEKFREYIRLERARELYSEEHRWWDLKRWRVAKEVLSKGIWGAYITSNGSGGFNFGKQQLTTAARVFENKHYWYPFPTSTRNMMSKFEQNPGW